MKKISKNVSKNILYIKNFQKTVLRKVDLIINKKFKNFFYIFCNYYFLYLKKTIDIYNIILKENKKKFK